MSDKQYQTVGIFAGHLCAVAGTSIQEGAIGRNANAIDDGRLSSFCCKCKSMVGQ